jgi:sugar O-acyltransferase (sialic acid O-acetyltransferase NeuD family)
VRDVVFWGGTGQAKVLRDIIESRGMRLVAVFDDTVGLAPPFSDVELYEGRPGFDRWRAGVSDVSAVGFLVAIGGEHGVPRVRIHRFLEAEGLVPVTAVHSKAFVAANATIGPGSQVLAQAAVTVEARLGTACIVNTGAVVDHECDLGDGVHVAGGARLAGLVHVGSYATIFTGAVVLPRIRIGEGAIVGAGAVVLEDVPPWSVAVGNPARVVSERSPRAP